jgi:hypothetical protein
MVTRAIARSDHTSPLVISQAPVPSSCSFASGPEVVSWATEVLNNEEFAGANSPVGGSVRRNENEVTWFLTARLQHCFHWLRVGQSVIVADLDQYRPAGLR